MTNAYRWSVATTTRPMRMHAAPAEQMGWFVNRHRPTSTSTKRSPRARGEVAGSGRSGSRRSAVRRTVQMPDDPVRHALQRPLRDTHEEGLKAAIDPLRSAPTGPSRATIHPVLAGDPRSDRSGSRPVILVTVEIVQPRSCQRVAPCRGARSKLSPAGGPREASGSWWRTQLGGPNDLQVFCRYG